MFFLNPSALLPRWVWFPFRGCLLHFLEVIADGAIAGSAECIALSDGVEETVDLCTKNLKHPGHSCENLIKPKIIFFPFLSATPTLQRRFVNKTSKSGAKLVLFPQICYKNMFFNIKIGLYSCDFTDLTMLIKNVKTASRARFSPGCRSFDRVCSYSSGAYLTVGVERKLVIRVRESVVRKPKYPSRSGFGSV